MLDTLSKVIYIAAPLGLLSAAVMYFVRWRLEKKLVMYVRSNHPELVQQFIEKFSWDPFVKDKIYDYFWGYLLLFKFGSLRQMNDKKFLRMIVWHEIFNFLMFAVLALSFIIVIWNLKRVGAIE